MTVCRPLPAPFYAGSILAVARRLLGQLVVREIDGRRLIGRIVETEAYAGRLDPGSHSFRGPTQRNRSMFGDLGRGYVYFTYGNHHCFNVVAGERRFAQAVLIRALEPLSDLEMWRSFRAGATRAPSLARRIQSGAMDEDLTNGPGKLCAALSIDRRLDGVSLVPPGPLWLALGPPVSRVTWTPRVGLGSNPAAHWFWRCIDRESTHTTPRPVSWRSRSRPSPSIRSLIALRARQKGESLPGSFMVCIPGKDGV